jgi:two-component system response regulator YcbB
MKLTFGIIDDDAVCRRMLQNIIEDCELGEVVWTADGGIEAIQFVANVKPDVVIIDLLMPALDGIEMIAQLKNRQFIGKFIMISQIINKDMVERAYQAGIDFFIHKPINRVEVEAVLRIVGEKWKLSRSLSEIKLSLQNLDRMQPIFPSIPKKRTVRDVVQHILMDMGITGESGTKDIISILEYLIEDKKPAYLPPLKELYEGIAEKYKSKGTDIIREGKAIEQRLRRTVMSALTNLASLGLTDYSNPKFEYYALLYFDFQDVRLKMKEIDDETDSGKGKVNVKKFLQVFYLETLEKIKN